MRTILTVLTVALFALVLTGCCCDDKPNECNSCGPVEPTIREGGHGWR
jgi:hypothetical protein